ncbi:hypothetical protein MLD38_013852 [Melastoma candidum]|uniref:Uncharacterized protein n=1 Tax=Melastoma candidum TaxID=119954 RepID=A0ACB9RE07_9MYRT|nr:hypothetical protein MLD38_013852 [Melastoma candidum]
MNGATFPEMLQCVNPSGAYAPHITVLERQRAALKCRHQQQQQGTYEDFFGPVIYGGGPAFCMTSQGLVVADASNNHPIMLDLGVRDNWPDFGGFYGGPGLLEPNYGMVPKTLGGYPLAHLAPAVEKVEECGTGDQKSGHGQVGKEGSRKRKVDQLTIIKTEDDDDQEKKMRGCTEETESKITVQSYNNDRRNNKKGAVSKENAKNSEAAQKQDYIHVRARRGQATDSHSLAERVRREKISERMKFLQDLVPGCNKITGKAGMLDEIINYVQSLQRQVEFLSMKLAAVNPRLDIDIDSLFAKDISPACAPNFSAIEAGGISELTNQGYLHFNPGNQVVSCVGIELGVNNPDQGLWSTISAPLPVTEKFLEAPSFAQMQSQSAAATWDDDMSLQQSLYSIEFQQARGMAIPSHPFTGGQLDADMKLQM